MSKSPWYTPKNKKLIVTITDGTEEKLMERVKEHEKNGFKVLRVFSNNGEKYIEREKWFAKIQKVDNKIV